MDGSPGEESYVQGKGWSGRNTYDAFEQLSEIYKRTRGRTGFAKHDVLTRLLQTYKNWERAKEQVRLAKEKNTETRTVSTDYYSEARKLDRGRVSNYYSTPHELAARAFESWIYDEIQAKEGRSDYLVHSVTNDLYMPGVNPYPEAEERQVINQAWRALFDVLETRTVDGNEQLFSRAGRPLKEVQMTETAMIEETGELVEIETTADVRLRQIDKRIANIEQLRECLRT